MSTTWKVSKYGVFSGPNAGKYGPEKLRIWTLFTQWRCDRDLEYKELT